MKLTLASIRKCVDSKNYIKAFKLAENVDFTRISKDYVERYNGYLYSYEFLEGKAQILVLEDEEILTSLNNYKKEQTNEILSLYEIALALALIFSSKLDNNKNTNGINSFKELINNFFIEDVIKNVILKPILEFNNNNLLLNINIIIENKEYLIKDIKQLLDISYNYASLKLGKNIYNISLESFDLKSQKLLKIISKNEYDIKLNKDILINLFSFDELYNLYLDDYIYFKDYFGLAKIFITNEELNLDLELKKEVLSFNHSFLIIGYKRFYIVENFKLYKSQPITKNEEWSLFKFIYENKKLSFKDNLENFFDVYDKIKDYVKVDEEYLKKYPLKKTRIDTYIDYQKKTVTITPKIYVDDLLLKEDYSTIQNTKISNYLKILKSFKFIKIENTFALTNIEDISKFITDGPIKLANFGNLFTTNSYSLLKIKNDLNYKIKLNHRLGFFTLEVLHNYKDEEIKEILKGYNNKSKFIMLDDYTIFKIDDSIKRLNDTIYKHNLDDKNLSKEQVKPLYELLNFSNEDINQLQIDEKIYEIITDIKNYKNNNFMLSDSLNKVMREYQKDAFKWMKTLTKYNFSGILADEMGLGKSIEAISLISSDEVIKPSLLIVPASLIYNWKNEFNKWDKALLIKAIVGTKNERIKIISNIKEEEKAVYITSYDLLKRDISLYKNNFRFVIIDEAQFIKNQNTKKAKAVKALESDVRFSLTGTPIENSLDDIWSIFDFLMPGYLGNYKYFKANYDFIVQNNETQDFDLLLKKISPFILRRTKSECLKDLPIKNESIYFCELEEEQRKIYDSYLIKAKKELELSNNKIEILSYLTRLRQICVYPKLFLENFKSSSSKINLALTLISEFALGGHKVLLFSQFPSVFDYISETLLKINIAHLILTGKNSSIEKAQLVDRFNSDGNIKVFLISLRAGGFGLNLTSADKVIHLDPWWNLAAENQASDRVHRIGQERNVEIIKIIAAKTIEEKVLDLQQFKKSLFDKVINSNIEENMISKDDIKYILN